MPTVPPAPSAGKPSVVDDIKYTIQDMPIWGWFVIVAGILMVFYLMHRSSSSSVPASAVTGVDPATGLPVGTTGVVGTGDTGLGNALITEQTQFTQEIAAMEQHISDQNDQISQILSNWPSTSGSGVPDPKDPTPAPSPAPAPTPTPWVPNPITPVFAPTPVTGSSGYDPSTSVMSWTPINNGNDQLNWSTYIAQQTDPAQQWFGTVPSGSINGVTNPLPAVAPPPPPSATPTFGGVPTSMSGGFGSYAPTLGTGFGAPAPVGTGYSEQAPVGAFAPPPPALGGYHKTATAS